MKEEKPTKLKTRKEKYVIRIVISLVFLFLLVFLNIFMLMKAEVIQPQFADITYPTDSVYANVLILNGFDETTSDTALSLNPSIPTYVKTATIQHGFAFNSPCGHTYNVSVNEIIENDNYTAFGVSCICGYSELEVLGADSLTYILYPYIPCENCNEFSRINNFSKICIYCGQANIAPVLVTSVEIGNKPTNNTMTSGNTRTLTAIIGPINATNKNVTWSSSNGNAATIDTDGKITAHTFNGIVTTEIIVKTQDGNKTDSFTLTVNPILTVSQTTWNPKAIRSNQTVNVTTIDPNIPWIASSDSPSWLTVSPTNGTGNYYFTMTATENTITSSRSGIVTVTGGGVSIQISVKQAAATICTHGNWTYTNASSGSSTHTRTCGLCTYSESESHKNFIYTSNGSGGHWKKCGLCTNNITEGHNYVNNVCKDCQYKKT